MTDRQLVTAAASQIRLIAEEMLSRVDGAAQAADPALASDQGVLIVLEMYHPILGAMLDMVEGLDLDAPGVNPRIHSAIGTRLKEVAKA